MGEVKQGPRELWYFADPMCSWCWGFSPVIDALTTEFADRLSVRVFAGGLAPGTREAMTEALKREVRRHWEHVHEASGQPFDYTFFEREGFVYDTEPACRALVAARELDDQAALRMLARLHRGFYVQGRDLTDAAVLASLAAEEGFDEAAFAEALTSEKLTQATHTDFALARNLGIRGYPTLVGRDGETLTGLTVGYQPLEKIRPVVEAWLRELEVA